MAILDIIPGIYFLSVLFKLKLLSTNNLWHETLFNKTYGHLHEFDIFDFAWSFSSNRLIYVLNKFLSAQTYMYSKLNGEQLDTIAAALEEAADKIKQCRNLHDKKQSVRITRLLNKSQIVGVSKTAAEEEQKRKNSALPEKSESRPVSPSPSPKGKNKSRPPSANKKS